jgi:hypothetical protein
LVIRPGDFKGHPWVVSNIYCYLLLNYFEVFLYLTLSSTHISIVLHIKCRYYPI